MPMTNSLRAPRPGLPGGLRVGWRIVLLIGLLASLLGTATAAAQGTTIAVGSGVRDDNHAVWQAIVAAAGGPGAHFAVFSAPAGEPDRAAAQIIAALVAHGASAEHIRVGPRIAGSQPDADVRNPTWVARVQAASGVFFSGGQQHRLLDLLLPDGQSTPLLDAVRALWQRGGVVAGESAGAAVMSAIAFREPPSPLMAMKGWLGSTDGSADGRTSSTGTSIGTVVGPGFGFMPARVMVDQHFLARGRIGRLLPLMVSLQQPLGLGIEEHSAAVLQGDDLHVIGDHGVLVVDLAQASSDPAMAAFNLQGARLSYLHSGDRYHLPSGTITPADGRRTAPIARSAPGFNGRHEGPVFFADMLGKDVILQAMVQLVDSTRPEVLGLSFAAQPQADDPAPALGFEWRLSAGPDTLGWGGARGEYTLARVRLDLRPVRMAQPLYRAWQPP